MEIILVMIFNIQRCSNKDGYGLRTTVFFKGCPLFCKWCANPESQSFKAEVMESTNRCIGCMACVSACTSSAINLIDGFPKIDRKLCDSCHECVKICYASAKRIVGDEYSPKELFDEIKKDKVFFLKSGGGVTFSGGEPLAQPDFLYEVAKLCHNSGIHVMLESCGYGEFEKFEKALEYVDAMYFDVKHIDPIKHKQITGYSNELILENLHKIAAKGIHVIVRTPVIPGYTDQDENIKGIAKEIRDIPNVIEYELLAYHNLGESKYNALGRKYHLTGTDTPSKERMFALSEVANKVFEGEKKCFYLAD